MSSSRSEGSSSDSPPLTTQQWQLEHAATPPQTLPMVTPRSSADCAASRMVVPGSTSTVTPQFTKVIFGISLDLLDGASGQGLLECLFHPAPGEIGGRSIQVGDGFFDAVVVAPRHRLAQRLLCTGDGFLLAFHE